MAYKAGPEVASVRVMTLMLPDGDPCGGTFDGFFQSFASLRHRPPRQVRGACDPVRGREGKGLCACM
jgi:hypothetical protein